MGHNLEEHIQASQESFANYHSNLGLIGNKEQLSVCSEDESEIIFLSVGQKRLYQKLLFP